LSGPLGPLSAAQNRTRPLPSLTPPGPLPPRTDALGAYLLTSDVDDYDKPFCTGGLLGGWSSGRLLGGLVIRPVVGCLLVIRPAGGVQSSRPPDGQTGRRQTGRRADGRRRRKAQGSPLPPKQPAPHEYPPPKLQTSYKNRPPFCKQQVPPTLDQPRTQPGTQHLTGPERNPTHTRPARRAHQRGFLRDPRRHRRRDRARPGLRALRRSLVVRDERALHGGGQGALGGAFGARFEGLADPPVVSGVRTL
jgi:hypothetical protein